MNAIVLMLVTLGSIRVSLPLPLPRAAHAKLLIIYQPMNIMRDNCLHLDNWAWATYRSKIQAPDIQLINVKPISKY